MLEEPEEQPPADAAGQLNWIRDAVLAARELGVADEDEIVELLQTTNNEDVRAQALQVVQRVKEGHEKFTAVLLRMAGQLHRLSDAPTELSQKHVTAQGALLERIAALTVDADAAEVAVLAQAYAALPPPYADLYFWPVAPTELVDAEQHYLDKLPPPDAADPEVQ